MQNWQANTLSITVATDDAHAAKRTFTNVTAEIKPEQIQALGNFVAQLAAAPFTTAVLKTTHDFSF
ncbi:hypothetical protein RA086_04910 [Lactiplantibacillus sp. WILCCON 0030]|uniref:DUF1659 domain-containing protein n=1 Tax=Lactiplantibacillus brownii TaxID=3069269 RepID=A0ABU1A7R5_9LACO|nr:hypothetical protein [Lactiplantibacillus brownii]MDQ7936983.1 hypothetical protein [Lactiplantibacillus brownii]